MAKYPDVVDGLVALSIPGRSQRTKLIVGIDYGTTYTGVAFVHQNAVDLKDIKTFTDWPGVSEHSEHYEKTPSVYAYANENPDQDGHDAWGYEVEPGSRWYSWTKLLLDVKARSSDDDDPNLPAAMKSGILSLPQGKKAVDVVADYLSKVHEHIIEAIKEKCGGSDFFDVTPIEYWLTVPAIWSDEAKFATREAALKAGFGAREMDEVNLIPEPEAAAVLALKASLDHTDDLVKPQTGVLVCDCGGGTVDITSYIVKRTHPRLVLDESGVGRGAKCGGTFVDRNLHRLLSLRYGEPFSCLPTDRIGPNSRFMAAFEAKKQSFSTNNTRKSMKLPLKIPAFEKSDKVIGYDKKYSDILLSEQDMLNCFKPVVDKIISLIGSQLDAVKSKGQPQVNTVVLVGGLGCSRYVRECVSKWCHDIGIRMVTPWSGAWSAVARGAALQGLGAVKVQKRILRRHYGQEVAKPFREGIDVRFGRRWERRWKDQWTGETLLNEHMTWMVGKHDVFDDTTEAVYAGLIQHHAWTGEGKKMKECTLYSCSFDNPPSELGIEKVGTLVLDYKDLDMDDFESKWDDEIDVQVYKLPFKVFMKLGDKQGTLVFRSEIAGKAAGEASIDFSEH